MLTFMAERLELRPKRVLLYFRLAGSVVLPLIMGAVAGTIASAKGVTGIGVLLAMIFVVLSGLNAVHTWFHFHSIRYELDDTNFISSKGVLWKMKRSTPFEKITNTDVRQGPIQRLIGVGDVWVFTPSTGALLPEDMLCGVENPHEVRKEILTRTDSAKGGIPAPVTPAGEANGQVLATLREISATLRNIEAKLK